MSEKWPGVDMDRLHDPAIFQAIRQAAIARKAEAERIAHEKAAESSRKRRAALAKGRAAQQRKRRAREATEARKADAARRKALREAEMSRRVAERMAKAAAHEAKHAIPSDPKPDPYTQIRRMANARKAIESRKIAKELGIEE